MTIEIIGNRAVYDAIQNDALTSKEIIERAFNAILPYGYMVESIIARVDLVDIDSDNWRKEMEEVLEGKKALNQCIPIKEGNIFYWEHLRFRSPHEMAIARALNVHEVLFLPNCMARLGSSNPSERMNKEADFLICCDGKWGIMEVDGETFHTNAAHDHKRDRLFSAYGIRVIHRFTAKECTNDAELVVTKFLDLLRKNG